MDNDYKRYLESIILRAAEALKELEQNALLDFAIAVQDVENEAKELIEKLNTEEVILAAWEAEALRALSLRPKS